MANQGLINVIVNIDGILLHSKIHIEHKEQLAKFIYSLRNTHLKSISKSVSLEPTMTVTSGMD